MELPHPHHGADPAHYRTGLAGPWLVVLLTAALSLGATSATAQMANGEPIDTTIDVAPWLPEVLAADPYLLDPRFDDDGFRTFAMADLGNYPDSDFMGRKVARLSNGDLVVVGLTPPWRAANQANGLWNLGLERVSATGSPVGWTDGGTYAHFFSWHLIYPGLADSRIQYVQDVKVVNGYIYVLADVQQTWSGLGRQDVYLYTFTEAGRLLGEQRVFGIGNGNTTGDNRDFYGTALVPVSNSRIIVVAHAIDEIGPYVVASRVLIATAGPSTGTTSTDQAWGTPYNGNTGNRYVTYYGPSELCTTVGLCDAVPAAATKAEGFSDNDIYVAGSVKYNSANDWDVFTLKFSGETGAVITGYSDDGWTRNGFDMPNTDNNDQARGLYVHQNEIWVAATVNRLCQTGIGVLKLNAATGAVNPAFGPNGRVVFGGSDGSICIQGAPGYDVAGMSATSGRMGIVGRVQRGPLIGSPAIYNPALGVVDAATGEVLSLDDYAVTYADYEPTPGTRMGDGFLYDVLGIGNAFTVVGDARNSSQGNRFRYVVGRMIPTSTDTLFKNGFD